MTPDACRGRRDPGASRMQHIAASHHGASRKASLFEPYFAYSNRYDSGTAAELFPYPARLTGRRSILMRAKEPRQCIVRQ
jgi:hypothetical protein